MVAISKPKLAVVLTVLVFLAVPTIQIGHALYIIPLATNVLYADDFENYGAITNPETGGGWFHNDNDAGGVRDINNTIYYSPAHSLQLRSSNVASGKFDIQRDIFGNNQTKIIGLSFWFTFNNKTRNEPNQLTASIETWDYANKYECVVFFNIANANVQVGATSGLPNSGIVNLRLAAFDDTRMTGSALSQWHHVYMQCNISSRTWVSIVVDNWDLGPALNNQINGAPMTSIADPSMLIAGKPFTIPMKIEFANVNPGTWVPGTDIYWKAVDDVIVSDNTPGQPNIIQFGLTAFSAWYPVLIAAIGVLYGTSGIGLARRVILGKTEGMLSNYKMIFLTGLIASIGFILILVLGSFATQQVCNNTNGATCNY